MSTRPAPLTMDHILESALKESNLPKDAHGIAYLHYDRLLNGIQADDVDARSAAARTAIHEARTEMYAEEESERIAGGGSRDDAIGPYVDHPVWFAADDDEKVSFLHDVLNKESQEIKIEGEDPRDLALMAMDVANERFVGKYRIYLSWLWQRFEHKTDKDIVNDVRKSGGTLTEATVRSGWRRATARLLQITHELRFHRHAVLSGDVDPRLRGVETLLDEPEHLATAETRLEGLRAEFCRDPRWYILLGKVKRRLGKFTEAIDAYKEALVWARNDMVRGDAHNAMGYAYDTVKQREEALAHWRMATELAPRNVST